MPTTAVVMKDVERVEHTPFGAVKYAHMVAQKNKINKRLQDMIKAEQEKREETIQDRMSYGEMNQIARNEYEHVPVFNKLFSSSEAEPEDIPPRPPSGSTSRSSSRPTSPPSSSRMTTAPSSAAQTPVKESGRQRINMNHDSDSDSD